MKTIYESNERYIHWQAHLIKVDTDPNAHLQVSETNSVLNVRNREINCILVPVAEHHMGLYSRIGKSMCLWNNVSLNQGFPTFL